ncbi:MAG: methyltransferase domain-containing protein [Chloroflexi bacterium]|nr:methyltransferase domain-containing protein [Chloroflexota bacterium]
MTTTTAVPNAPTMDEIMGFAFKVVGDLAAAMSGAHIYMGDRMGLFKTLAKDGPLTVPQLAEKTGLQERYLREWASVMATSELVDYDPATEAFALPAAKAMVLANEDSPVFVQGIVQMMPSHYGVIPSIMRAFREGGGVPYSEYGEDTFEGTERLFRTGYLNFLVQEWLPATGYIPRLEAGAKVADIGCGRGQAIMVLARAFPKSRFYGFDNYGPVVDAARANAEAAGLSQNTTFEARGSTELPQTGDFDLMMNCDSLHDMVDPEGCARSVRGALKADGAWFIIERNVSDHLEENINPVGRLFYSISGLQCMPASLAHGGKGYGACMGPAKTREIATGAGFTRFEKLPIENPFNQFFLARP